MELNEISEREIIDFLNVAKSNKRRIERLEEKQDNLEKLVEVMATFKQKQEYMEGDITEIKSDVKVLSETPAKRWDMIATTAITAIVGAVVGFLLSGGFVG